MIEIYFQDTLDAAKMYTSLQMEKEKNGINRLSISYDHANLITITCTPSFDMEIKSYIVLMLTNFILNAKEDQWMSAIISEFFYYSDDEEQQQILSLAHSISDGEICDIPEIHKIVSRRQLIEQILNEFLKAPISFSFESFVKFRLRKYYDILFQFVEIAIDEYKMEQEYQAFIHTLRELLRNRKSKLTCLHVLHHEHSFHFYDEHFKQLQHDDLKSFLDRKLFQQQPIYIDSATIAPLVSIAPEIIHLYTNDMDDNMIQTILNIFQERVRLYTTQEFRKSLFS